MNPEFLSEVLVDLAGHKVWFAVNAITALVGFSLTGEIKMAHAGCTGELKCGNNNHDYQRILDHEYELRGVVGSSPVIEIAILSGVCVC